MINVTCPTCGEVLEISDDLAGGSIRCGNCRMVFTAPSSDDDAPKSSRRRSRSSFEEERRRKNRGVPAWVWVFLTLIGLFTCGCCGGVGYWVHFVMNPEFEQYDSPDGRWSALFPGPVQQKSRPTGRELGETGKCYEHIREMVGPLKEYYFVSEVELTDKDKARKPSEVAEDLAKGLTVTEAGRQIYLRPGRAHQNHEAADVAIENTDGRHTIARAVVANGRGYIIAVIGFGQPNASPWVDEFIDSLEIHEPGEEKKPANPFNKKGKPRKAKPEDAPPPPPAKAVKPAKPAAEAKEDAKEDDEKPAVKPKPLAPKPNVTVEAEPRPATPKPAVAPKPAVPKEEPEKSDREAAPVPRPRG